MESKEKQDYTLYVQDGTTYKLKHCETREQELYCFQSEIIDMPIFDTVGSFLLLVAISIIWFCIGKIS